MDTYSLFHYFPWCLKAHLFGGGGAVVDEHEGGEDVGGEADDGDEVWSDPGGNSSH